MGISWVPEFFRGAVQDLRVRPRGNVPALDVLRSIAILLVFTGHYAAEFQGTPRVQALPVVHWGWTGVDLFFVLSGFLIGGQLWKELKRAGHIRIGRFLLRRGLRIWPLYYAFVVFVAAEGLFGRTMRGMWSDACFFSNYIYGQIGGGWTLSTEEQFYILAPITIALFARIIKPKHLWILPAAGLLGLVVNRVILLSYWQAQYLDASYMRFALITPLYTHADGLGVGLLLAWFAVFRPELIASKRLRLSVCGGMLVVGTALYYLSHYIFCYTTLGLIFGAAALWGLGLQRTPRPLGWHGFYIISRLSFGMYLNQFGLLERLSSLLLPLRVKGGEAAFWMLYAVCLLASIAIAFVTFQMVEWPFLQLRARWLESAKRIQPELATQAAGGA